MRVGLWQWARGTLLIGGVPLVAILALGIGTALPAADAVAAFSVTLVAAGSLAWVWLSTLAALTADLRRAADGHPPGPPRPVLLPAARAVAEQANRLARGLAEREALVNRLRRADTAIVEALPDPLLVLGADRSPLRANAAARRVFGSGERDDTAAFLRHPSIAGAVDTALERGAPAYADVVLPVPVPRDLSAQVIPMDPPLADGGGSSSCWRIARRPARRSGCGRTS
ncbi:hypothetical protein ACE7GA_06690 [Roseomonas sp. CCTCC AB2023176]|uniref:hypothetical protein n=1 Tax=Roseomonas sp. CCTCC AB2023176 TaxID=3342640 RepID=UPI0035E1AE69